MYCEYLPTVVGCEQMDGEEVSIHHARMARKCAFALHPTFPGPTGQPLTDGQGRETKEKHSTTYYVLLGKGRGGGCPKQDAARHFV